MGFLQNTCKPEGMQGKIMVNMMNGGHAKLAAWGFTHVKPKAEADVLDVGCGGGANLAVWLDKCKEGKVFGIDYSDISVAKSKQMNKQEIDSGRCQVLLGSAEKLPFRNEMFDYVSAFETIYFWPNIEKCFQQVYNSLKKGGKFIICNEADGLNKADEKWEKKIQGMTIYKAEEIRIFLEHNGFKKIEVNQENNHWLCVVAEK